MSDDRERDLHNRDGHRLMFKPVAGDSIRWLPRHGKPVYRFERFSQALVKGLANVPVYTAFFSTLTLVVLFVAAAAGWL